MPKAVISWLRNSPIATASISSTRSPARVITPPSGSKSKMSVSRRLRARMRWLSKWEDESFEKRVSPSENGRHPRDGGRLRVAHRMLSCGLMMHDDSTSSASAVEPITAG